MTQSFAAAVLPVFARETGIWPEQLIEERA